LAAGASSSLPLRFGVFELDAVTGELRKSGYTVRLRPQAAKILVLLASRPGQLITREELREKIWGNETFVDFEHGLNLCIREVRAALDDDADTPRYVETLPRRGYRFIARVELIAEDHAVTSAPIPETSRGGSVLVGEQPASSRKPRLVAALAASLLALALGLGTYFARGRFWPRGKASSSRAMLAVLPFQNLTGDPNQDYFSDGLTEEMITDLGRLNPERLGVIARTSVMHYKDTREDVQQIGHALGVDYVLEGAVRRQGDQVRITAQLIQVRDQTHLWAQSYDRALHNMLAVQDDVARNIADEIKIEFPQQPHSLASTRAMNPDVHELYLKGRYFWNKRTEDGIKKAAEYFEEATQKDSNYALAYAGLADCYGTLNVHGVLAPKEAFPKAERAAMRALEIDDRLAEAHTSLAWARFHYDWDPSGAEREYKKAIELNPNYETAHHWYALYLAEMGRQAEANEQIKRARELDPLSLIINANSGLLFYFDRRNDQAVQHFRETLDMDPNFPQAHFYLGRAYERKGMFAEALAELQSALTLSGGKPVMLAALGHLYAVSGKQREAREVLGQLHRLAEQMYVPPYHVAGVYAALGQKDQAFEWLKKAEQDRDSYLIWLRVDPMWDGLGPDPRFQNLLRRIGLPQ
jgi:TolB-like protein/DNA-binding winged helix-turn-helix (wHTH) protein